MTSAEKRALRPILEAVKASNLDGLGAMATAMLDRAARKAPKKSGPTRKADKKAKREAHRMSTAALRCLVFLRATPPGLAFPCCELCAGVRHTATELAHLEGGVGRRRQRQTEANTAAACHGCNSAWDDHPEWRPMMAKRWSERSGWPIPEGVRQAAALKGWKAEG